jgi:hypothetical protein
MSGNLIIKDSVSSTGPSGLATTATAIYPAGSTITQTLILLPSGQTGSQYASPVGFSMLTLNPSGTIQLTAQLGSNSLYINQQVNALLQIDDTVDTFQLINNSTTESVTVTLTFIVAIGTPVPVTGFVTSLNGLDGEIVIDSGSGIAVSVTGQTIGIANGGVLTVNSVAPSMSGNVNIIAADASDLSGVSLIAANGASTGLILLKTLVAGTGITLASDANGNLVITGSATYTLPPATPTTLGGVQIPAGSGLTVDSSGNLSVTGAVTSVSGQSGIVVVKTQDANDASGTSLVVDSGATTGVATLKTLVAGTGTTITADGNGNLVIGSMGQYVLPAANTTTLGGIIVGSGLAITGEGVLTATGTYTLPPANTTTLGGVIIQQGLTVDGSGNLSANVQSVNGQTGAVLISANEITTGTFFPAVLGTSSAANSILTTNGSDVSTWVQSLSASQIGASSGDNLVLTTNASGVSTWVTTIPTANLPAALVGSVDFQTAFIPGTTTLAAAAAGNKGWYYVASAAGTYTPPGGSLLTFSAGDWIISDGTAWSVLSTQGAITSVNGQTGAVVITATSLGLAAVATTGAYSSLTGTPAPYTLPAATTGALGGVIVGSGLSVTSGTVSANVVSVAGRTGAITLSVTDVSGAAALASPALSGVPTAPTATAGTNTTQIATTAFVQAAVTSSVGVASFNTRTGAVTLQAADISAAGGALLASPVFTGRVQSDASSFTVVALGSVSGTQTLNLASASMWTATITGATTFAFTNTLGSNTSEAVYLRLSGAGSHTVSWPAGTMFSNGTAPTFSTGIDLVGVLYDVVSSAYMVFMFGTNMAT